MNCKNLAENPLSTVAAEYEPLPPMQGDYQSEAELEAEFIKICREQGYEYAPIKNERDLLLNLRAQMEALNDYRFSDAEWNDFCSSYLLNKNDGILEKTAKIQENPIYELKGEDGRLKRNIRIIDKDNLGKNRLQIINQYATEGEGGGELRRHRYDVTILVNGLPLAHIELKRRGGELREAFNQISRYQRESFWAQSGLFEYAQIFIISNGTHTKYYANTVRKNHIDAQQEKRGKAGNSFEFTSWWADARNERIADLRDFAKTFFGRVNLLNILTKYCVFDTEKNLKILRPYQIAAVERVLNKIAMSDSHRRYSSPESGGYIWHTTGSGKTLTSFKCATLARDMDCVEKVLFVVDRRDLDSQTIKEYNKFQKDCVEGNNSTKALAERLGSSAKNARIIVTTIQKLDRFISGNKGHELYSKPVVLIFDECHRSQFGDMQRKITKAFKKYFMFGFTGTPIFAETARGAVSAVALARQSPKARAVGLARTTEQVFGRQLHSYTILNAIHDENVLKFRVDYIGTMRKRENIIDKNVRSIDRKGAEQAEERISNIVAYIREHFDQKTLRNGKAYRIDGKRQRGFNSIFAVSSIEAAKLYYRELMKQQGGLPQAQRLKIALIYSFGANETEQEADAAAEAAGGELPDENFEPEGLSPSSRDFLAGAIQQYNADFQTNYDTSAKGFQDYYENVSRRMKKREIDLLLVVDMFLTGFDAKTLNTLWVDKNLRYHGLMQAFSRTNRILNSVKTYGNIVCFRNLEEETNKAMALFGNKDAKGIILLRNFKDYYNGYEDENGQNQQGYESLIDDLRAHYPLGQEIAGEKAEKTFIALFGSILKLKNILTGFDEFQGSEILSAAEFQDYQSRYLDLHDKLRPQQEGGEAEAVNDDIVFEMELVKQVTYDIDYILQLIVEWQKSAGEKQAEFHASIQRAISSAPELRSKKELINRFIDGLNAKDDVREAWYAFKTRNKQQDLQKIIAEENLKPEQAKKFMEKSFRNGAISEEGEDFDDCLPPMGRIGGNRQKKKRTVLARLRAFFEKYFGI